MLINFSWYLISSPFFLTFFFLHAFQSFFIFLDGISYLCLLFLFSFNPFYWFSLCLYPTHPKGRGYLAPPCHFSIKQEKQIGSSMMFCKAGKHAKWCDVLFWTQTFLKPGKWGSSQTLITFHDKQSFEVSFANSDQAIHYLWTALCLFSCV